VKLIIAGGRDIRPGYGFIDDAIKMLKPYRDEPIREIVCGGAQGVDSEGEHWASHHKGVSVEYFRADWNKYGKAAGPVRNKKMAEYADALLLIWDGLSRGSANMKAEMGKLGKPVYEIVLKGLPE